MSANCFTNKKFPNWHKNIFVVKTQSLFVDLTGKLISNNFFGVKMNFHFPQNRNSQHLCCKYNKDLNYYAGGLNISMKTLKELYFIGSAWEYIEHFRVNLNPSVALKTLIASISSVSCLSTWTITLLPTFYSSKFLPLNQAFSTIKYYDKHV